jgi:hypothetical protein
MRIKIPRIEDDFPISELNDASWEKAKEISIEKYWSGEIAPIGRHFRTKFLWSESAFYVRFQANQSEPLIISETPNLKTKTIGLWERDVCEIFVAPNFKKPEKYFEFEIAPTGEWIDLKVWQSTDSRETDFDYHSGMQCVARIEKDRVTMAARIPWKAFDTTPREDEVWKGNVFRCVGSGTTRGYLAWSPTRAVQPNFHVPEAFGDFEFLKCQDLQGSKI